MKQILKYPGAKNKIVEWIVSFIPEHKVYLEPFFGSGAVFFNKKPAKIETVNDLDGNVFNLFKVIRERPAELAAAVELTPYSRQEYEFCNIDGSEDDEVEKARKFLVRCWQSYGNGNVYKNGFRSSQQGNSPRTTLQWNQVPERIEEAAIRLKEAQIEQLDAVELLKRYDTEDVFTYLDPPYLPEIRKAHLYKYEMTEEDHVRLLEAVTVFPGKCLISGYDNGLYNDFLKGWNTATLKTQAEGGRSRIEKLWFNYDVPGQLNIFDSFQEGGERE